jgi:hypothetical protein
VAEVGGDAVDLADMAEIAKFQRSAVDEFCSKHDPRPSHSAHPFAYNRHILLDSTHNVLFCFLPKVGCTNLKLLLYISQGLMPRSELGKERDDIDQNRLMAAVRRTSLAVQPGKEREFSSYFKYIMVRNPLERLTSAFRSKIERFNLTGRLRDVPHYNWARRAIYKGLYPQLYVRWVRSGMKQPVPISFSDFIRYWLEPNDLEFKYDDHFMLIQQVCQPCRTRFDFYGNFRHFSRDAQVLVERVGARGSDLRQGYYSEDSSTDQRMRQYYSSLSEAQKRAVLGKMALELEFHYTIFPEERDSHKLILGINEDLPLSS